MKKYTKEQILIAGEIGEVSMIDVRHVVSLLDEAVNLERERKLRKHNVSGELAVDDCKCSVGGEPLAYEALAKAVSVATCQHEYFFNSNGYQCCKWCGKGISA